ncbi:DUF4328 domain-containing protein [Streptomyces showdoensis]|uniref:DUF4328 domain-containing protein n=1 Tax=Streptomyces showdoensis TaxID=68268 RepID=A0A2P2GMZ6_STREW|nr:DUF4328 domain-containing protein [Streptomyces showdoensis]KKZ72881.1 hypothetical protein VO63_16220 [Streptomyces showdoensis]
MLRNPNGLSYAVVSLLGATAAADVVSLIATSGVRSELTGPLADHPDPEGYAGTLASTVAWSAQGLLLLATAVLFIVWMFRLRGNADVWAPDLQRRAKGWMIAGWVVPIVAFWFPRGQIVDIWRASRPEPYGPDRGGEFVLVNCWWLFFLVSRITGEVGSRVFDRAMTVDELVAGTQWMLAADALDVLAAVLAILLVRRLTSMQHLKATGMIPAA